MTGRVNGAKLGLDEHIRRTRDCLLAIVEADAIEAFDLLVENGFSVEEARQIVARRMPTIIADVEAQLGQLRTWLAENFGDERPSGRALH